MRKNGAIILVGYLLAIEYVEKMNYVHITIVETVRGSEGRLERSDSKTPHPHIIDNLSRARFARAPHPALRRLYNQ